MSAKKVRDDFTQFLTDNTSEKLVDFTAAFQELDEFLADKGVGRNNPWLGLQFIGNEEEPITVPARNDSGKYREIGVVLLHIVDVAKLGAGGGILDRAETLRSLLRGRRIGSMVIETVSPPNFEAGATLQFEGGWTSASVTVSYEYDIDL